MPQSSVSQQHVATWTELTLFSLQLSSFLTHHSTLEGFYVDDALQGQGVYTYEDGGVLYGTYVDGELNGSAQEFDGEGRLVFKGQYKDNSRCGECLVYYPVSQLGAHNSTLPTCCTCVEITLEFKQDSYLGRIYLITTIPQEFCVFIIKVNEQCLFCVLWMLVCTVVRLGCGMCVWLSE